MKNTENGQLDIVFNIKYDPKTLEKLEKSLVSVKKEFKSGVKESEAFGKSFAGASSKINNFNRYLGYAKSGLSSLGSKVGAAASSFFRLSGSLDSAGSASRRSSSSFLGTRRSLNLLTTSATKAKSAISSLGSKLKSVATTTLKWGALGAGLAGAGSIIGIGKKIGSDGISFLSQMEKFQGVLEAVTKSSEKAQKSMQWIKEFAEKTPFDLNATAEAFVQLKVKGIEPTNGTLKILGDTAAAMNKSIVDAVEMLADALIGDNERLNSFGIKAKVVGNKIAYGWTDSSNKSKLVIIDNNKQIIQSTLLAIYNSKYAGAMQKLESSWQTKMSNLKAAWSSFAGKIMKDSGIFDILKGTIGDTTKELKKFTNSKKDLSGIRAGFVALVNLAFKLAKGMVYAGGAVVVAFSNIGNAIQVAKYYLNKFTNALVATGLAALDVLHNISIFGLSDAKFKEYTNQLLEFKKAAKFKDVQTPEEFTKKFTGDMEKIKDGVKSVNKVIDNLQNNLNKNAKNYDKKPKVAPKNGTTAPTTTVPGAINGDLSDAEKIIKSQKKEDPLDSLNKQLAIAKAINNEEKIRELQLKKLELELRKSGATQEQIQKAIAKKREEFAKKDMQLTQTQKEKALSATIAKLAKEEEYYETIGNKEKYREAHLKKMELMYKREGYSQSKINQMLAAEKERLIQKEQKLHLTQEKRLNSIAKKEEKEIERAQQLAAQKEQQYKAALQQYYQIMGMKREANELQVENTAENLLKGGLSQEQVAQAVSKLNTQFNIKLKIENKEQLLEYYNTIKNSEKALQLELEITKLKWQEKGFTAAQIQDMLAVKTQEINDKLKAQQNTIFGGLYKYHLELKKKILDTNNLTYQSFNKIENGLVNGFTNFFDVTSKGFLNFKTLSKTLFKDILVEIERLIIKTLVLKAIQASLGFFGFSKGGVFGGGDVQPFAKGGVLYNGAERFASGGVFSSPTFFGMQSGLGVLGEAGPEAILPLKRGKNGSLGVVAHQNQGANVNVIVNNNAPVAVSTAPKNGGIEVNIEEIKAEIAQEFNTGDGVVANSLTNNYGVSKVLR